MDQLPKITVPSPAVARKPAAGDVPLTVAHLFAWTAGCALYLGAMQVLLTPQQQTAGAGYLSLRSASAGAGLGGWLMLLPRLWRASAFPRHPGEWILLTVGARFLLEVLTAALPVNANPALAAAVNACVLLPGALLLGRSHVWRAVFCLMVAAYALVPLTGIATTLTGLSIPSAWREAYVAWGRNMFLLVLLIAGVATDARTAVRRPWSHWVGLAAWCWEGVVAVLYR